MNRRSFLKSANAAGLALALPSTTFAQEKKSPEATAAAPNPKAILLKDYRPRSIHKVPVTHIDTANFPIIDGRLAVRVSAYSSYNGCFIDNIETTRHWYNGTISNNAEWAGNDYNTEHQEGGRIAIKGVLNDSWSATLSFDYQRLTALGAWDEDPNIGPRKVSRFGPEFLGNQDKIGQLHVDGDVGIADLVFASTYWSLPTRRQDEYSQYMENFAPSYTPFFPNGAPAGSQQGFACQHDPVDPPDPIGVVAAILERPQGQGAGPCRGEVAVEQVEGLECVDARIAARAGGLGVGRVE